MLFCRIDSNKKIPSKRVRTHDPQVTSLTLHPLRHSTTRVEWLSFIHILVEPVSVHNVHFCWLGYCATLCPLVYFRIAHTYTYTNTYIHTPPPNTYTHIQMHIYKMDRQIFMGLSLPQPPELFFLSFFWFLFCLFVCKCDSPPPPFKPCDVEMYFFFWICVLTNSLRTMSSRI